jgi:NAD dependent epimerase/dehydratase family enzyme
MGDTGMTIALIITAGVFGLVGTVMIFVNKWAKQDHEIEKLKLQKETAELEVKQMEMKAKLLEEENKKYDNLINNDDKRLFPPD